MQSFFSEDSVKSVIVTFRFPAVFEPTFVILVFSFVYSLMMVCYVQ